MRLNRLRLVNFRQHADTTVRFDTGLTGIVGANGSGKSTLLEAIAWALYGMSGARGSRDGIRSLKAKARDTVRVELDFELGGHRFLVVRGLTGAELYLDGAAAPIANSTTAVSEVLRRRLGMTRDEFFNTYFTGQKDLAVMAAMGATERGQFLSRVLGYERLRTAQEQIRDQRRLLMAEAAGLRQGMADPEVVAAAANDAGVRWRVASARVADASERRVAARRQLDELVPQWESAQRERENLQAVTGELRVAEGHEASLVREIARIERERAEVAAAHGELERLRLELLPLASLRVQLTEQESVAREEGRRQTLIQTEHSLRDELDRLRERRSQLDAAPELETETRSDLERRRVELGEADQALDAARTDWVRDKQEAETKIEQLKQQIVDLREQRERLVETGEDGTCPTCAQPLRDHYRDVLNLLDEQIETVTVDGRYYRARIEQLAQMPPDVLALEERRRHLYEAVAKLDRRLAKIQAGRQELTTLVDDLAAKERRHAEVSAEIAALPTGYDARRHDALRRDVERLAPVEARAQRLEAAVERDAALVTDWTAVTARLVDARGQVAALVVQRDALQHAERAFLEVRVEYEGAAAALQGEELAAVAAESERSSARAAVEAAERASRELAQAQAKLEVLTRNRRLHDELDRAYLDMRTTLNQQLRPEISEIASRYLDELTDGRYTTLELDESYEIIVLDDGIPKPLISGGEDDIANLVIRLAISQMIAERAGQPFSLLILDEVFGSLDDIRRQNVVELLRGLHDRFDQVIVVTHVEPVPVGFDHLITLRYDEETGTSRVEQDGGNDPVPSDEIAGAA